MLDAAMAPEAWDVVVLGGGATGLGTALDAALRGYRTLLLEKGDFAHGTSSRSTKLVHGGVRYLASGQVGLVREALHERETLLRNAPHVVHRLPFLVPSYRPVSRLYYGFGLWLYDRLAGPSTLEGSRIVSRDEAIAISPTLRTRGLRGGVVYEDAQFDDARMAIALLRSFLDAGGTALNYVSAAGFGKESGAIRRVLVRDGETGREWSVATRVVVNATGVFADSVRKMDDPNASALIRPSQGSHLVVSRSVLPGDAAVLIPKTDDGRVLFAIPWLGRVLIGTTDLDVDRVDEEPRPHEEEVSYLVDHASRYLANPIDRSHVLGTFAGLRPLIAPHARKETKAISREHAIFVSRSGLVTIVGGKWTTYRRMACDAVDRAIDVGGLERKECASSLHRLHGATDSLAGPFAAYGSDAEDLQSLLGENPGWSAPLVPGLPYVEAEVIWAVRREMARTVEDVLARRTRCLVLVSRGSSDAAPRVASLMAGELGRDEAWEREQVRRYRALCL